MATIPLATMGPTIDVNGISIPTFADILATLIYRYQAIFGSDVYLDPDSQDGQWLAIIASGINDSNAGCVATYNEFSPATSVGVGLSSMVKINGLARNVATNSTVDVNLVGQAGTTIRNGIVGDTLNQQWALPGSVVIPPGGMLTVTATATAVGALEAAPGSVNKIITPTLGWQTVTNVSSAAPGAPIETDAQLRIRQAKSTALPALTPLKGLIAAVAVLPGVTQVQPYENDTNITDANGIPPHTISLVVEGGDALAIAQAIEDKKTLGTGTYGTTAEIVADPFGVNHTIYFYRPTNVSIQVQVSLKALVGFTTAIKMEIQTAVAAYINALNIGDDVILTKVYVPANLSNSADGNTYDISAIIMGKNGGGQSGADIVIAFNEVATCDPNGVTFVVI